MNDMPINRKLVLDDVVNNTHVDNISDIVVNKPNLPWFYNTSIEEHMIFLLPNDNIKYKVDFSPIYDLK
jgi:hypothetical protein